MGSAKRLMEERLDQGWCIACAEDRPGDCEGACAAPKQMPCGEPTAVHPPEPCWACKRELGVGE